MVCKDELCRWFQKLNPRKRIEYMCALLHMCLPLELRFVGTVLEDYGKKDYHYLRSDEVTANKQSEIMKYKNITSPELLRAKVLTTLALMRSSSTTCAQIVYDIIDSNLDTVFSFRPGDDSNVPDEVLTVLALAVNHPAFMFEQRRRLHEHLSSLDNLRQDAFRDKADEDEVPLDLHSENHIPHYPSEEAPMPIHPAALCNRFSPMSQPRKVFVQNIDVYGPNKTTEKKIGPEYRIVATWSNGEVTEVGKRFREIQEFHRQMLDMFPDEKPQNGRIPSLPDRSPPHSTREEHIAEQIRALNVYFKGLTGVPSHVLESEHVCQFFKGLVLRQAQAHQQVPTPTMTFHHQSMVPVPDEEETINAVPPQVKSMTVRNSHLYYLPPHLNDAPNRIPRFIPQFYAAFHNFPQRFQTSHTCPSLMMPAHLQPQHQLLHQQQQQQQQHQQQQQQQQPSPVSPPRSELSSTTTSPAGSRSGSPDPATTSVVQLLKLLGLDKYISALGNKSFEQLSSLGSEEMTNLGLPQDAQLALRRKLDNINSGKQAPVNGMIDSLSYPSLSVSSPPSPPYMPSSYYRPGNLASPRLGLTVAEMSPGAQSDVTSGGSPPVSPGPPKIQGGILGKVPPGDSSEGSEDMERDKPENVLEAGKTLSHQQGKSAQVKVSSGGGSSSPHMPSANSRMTPPEDAAAKASVVPLQQQAMPHMLPYHFQYHTAPTPTHAAAPPGLLGQYIDPKADATMMGVLHNPSAAVANSNNNTNNNSYATDIPLRPGLLPQQTGVGAGTVRPGFKTGQPPQPAHGNLGVLQGKGIMAMPADPKPGSPVVPMPYVGIRPSEIQAPLGQDAGAPQRVPMYHLPYGRGQGGGGGGGAMAAVHLPPVHQQTQPGVIPFSLVTRSVQTSHPGSASVMTVSASHPVTMVTASHQTAAAAPSIHRSPSHGNTAASNGQQRDAGAGSSEPGGGASNLMTDASLRSSPLQVGGGGGGGSGVAVTVTQVAAAPSPPAQQQQHPCQQCAQGAAAQYSSHGQYSPLMYYPFSIMPQGPNGIIPQATAMSGYYPATASQHLPSGIVTNGYSPDVYSYGHPGYLSPAHGYPMMQGNSLYPSPSQPSIATAQQGGSGGAAIPPQAPAAVGGGLIASGQPAVSQLGSGQQAGSLIGSGQQGGGLLGSGQAGASLIGSAQQGGGLIGSGQQQGVGMGGALLGSGQQGAGQQGGGGQLDSGLTLKQRNTTGCYNCGSVSHRATDCPENSMETMSGKSVYQLDYKPNDESDDALLGQKS